MLDSKLCIVVVFGGNVDVSFHVNLIHLLEHGSVCALKMSQSTHK